MSQRAEAKRYTYNYVRRNILEAGKQAEEARERKEAEKARREQVIERYREALREKKSRGVTLKQQKQKRLEAMSKAQQERALQLQTQEEQKTWLALSCLAGASLSLLHELVRRKEIMLETTRKMKAAMILQRCYRKALLTINPKRLVRQRALQHLSLLSNLLGPEVAHSSRCQIYTCIVDSCEANAIGDCTIQFLGRGKRYVVRLIQKMWWKFREKQALRMAQLSLLWDTAVKEMTTHLKTRKKGKRRGKEQKSPLVDSTKPLKTYMQKCQQRYYSDLRTRRHNAPEFRYMLSLEEMKDLVREAGWLESTN